MNTFRSPLTLFLIPIIRHKPSSVCFKPILYPSLILSSIKNKYDKYNYDIKYFKKNNF